MIRNRGTVCLLAFRPVTVERQHEKRAWLKRAYELPHREVTCNYPADSGGSATAHYNSTSPDCTANLDSMSGASNSHLGSEA